MILVEANTLEEAYSKAARELSCSVTELELNVIQYPKAGFLFFGKKNAIVEAKKIGSKNVGQKHDKNFHSKNKNVAQNSNYLKKYPDKTNKVERIEKKEQKDSFHDKTQSTRKDEPKNTSVIEKDSLLENYPKKRSTIDTRTPFDDGFHKEKINPNSVTYEIKEKICMLFDNICFDITHVDVSVYDEETLLIEIDGPDAALLIGKEGCRYKALSYMLYSWINIKYGLGVRLEISEFLKNQEEMIGKYLSPIVERIHMQGKGQTKILDGVLIKIALERLRGEFPEKYVGIKSGKNGGRFIVINDFNRKNI